MCAILTGYCWCAFAIQPVGLDVACTCPCIRTRMYLRPRALMSLHAHRHVYSQYERREKEEERRECASELVRKGVEISTSYTLRGQVWHRSRVIAGNRVDARPSISCLRTLPPHVCTCTGWLPGCARVYQAAVAAVNLSGGA